MTATTFEKAWRKRRQFRGKQDEFIHWLYAIARNVANDYFRKSPTLVGLEEIATDANPVSISEDVERQIEFQRLVYTINQLSERDRENVTLEGREETMMLAVFQGETEGTPFIIVATDSTLTEEQLRGMAP